LAQLHKEFDYVLINVPAVILDGAASLWGPLVDGVILVVEANLTRREVARKAKESLESANVRLLGAVLNNRTFPIPETIYRNI
jgi:Mrp family chromosome partitioning ATPase